jgi:hypothetical protein
LKQHNNDQSVVQGGGTSASWKIEGVEKAFSQFRLTQTGKDSADTIVFRFLALRFMEFLCQCQLENPFLVSTSSQQTSILEL